MTNKNRHPASDPVLPKEPGFLYRNTDLPEGHLQPDKTSPVDNRTRHASVLLPLIWSARQWELLFIRRAENEHDRHSGQVAFPGGAREAQDQSPTDTALRETAEEIGVQEIDIDVLGELEIYTTSSRFEVTPVVARLNWPIALKPDPAEVARVFTIPLDWLKDQGNFEIRARQLRSGEPSDEQPNRHPVVYYQRYDGELLWGASARMTLNFLRALDQGQLVLPSSNASG